MPARPSKKAPRAARRKIWVHTFYLVQPFVQFFALIAVMLVLARCSPLAPSTDRAGGGLSAPPAAENSELAATTAAEDEIRANLKEINSAALEVIPQSEAEDIAISAPHVDKPVRENDVRGIFPGLGQKKKNRHVLFIPLSDESQASLFRDGQVRLPIGERLKGQTKDKPLKLFLQGIRRSIENKDIGATAYLVLPDATMRRANGAYNAIDLPVKISLSIPDDDRAFLFLEVVPKAEDAPQAQDNAALLSSALNESLELAILLE